MKQTLAHDVVVHLPHASPNLRLKGFRHRDLFDRDTAGVYLERTRCTDWFTDDLFRGLGVPIRFPYSRLLVDVERFPDDDREPMAAVGRGMIYTADTHQRHLRHPPRGRLRNTLHRLYRDHHQRLQTAVDAALAAHGRCLIIDAHSFPSSPWPIEPRRNIRARRPDICIGRDPFHTPPRLARNLAAAFRDAGFSVAFDHPYAGSITPLAHLNQTPAVHSIMIEINRKLYLDEASATKLDDYTPFRRCLRDILHRTIEAWRRTPTFGHAQRRSRGET